MLCNPAKKALFYSKVAEKSSTCTTDFSTVQEALIECIQEHLPDDAFETKQEIYHRGLQVKDYLREFRRSNPLVDDEKIVVVSHSCLISSMTASGYIGEGGQS